MNKEFKNFLKVADTVLEKLTESVAGDLIEKTPENYNPKFEDYGWYNNGVGMACCGGEYVYDEEKAYDDAKEKIAESIEHDYIEYLDVLFENKEFCTALADYIRSR